MTLTFARAAIAVAIVSFAIPASAEGISYTAKVEPGVALPISAQQSEHFGAGAGGAVDLGLAVRPYLDLQGAASYFAFEGKGAPAVTISAFGGGVRLKRPRGDREAGISPWVDADAAYLRTGALNRVGFNVGAGAQLSAGRGFWVGPFVRYMQIVEPAKAGHQDADARILVLGISVDIDTAKPPPHQVYAEAPVVAAVVPEEDADGDGVADSRDACLHKPGPGTKDGCPADADDDGVPDDADRCPNVAGAATAGGCPDRDGDTVADADNRCPAVRGEPALGGCPRYGEIVVGDSAIELSSPVPFRAGSSTLPPRLVRMLNEVAKALRDRPDLRLRVEAHAATSQGSRDLSLARAAAIRHFLIDGGVGEDRVTAKAVGALGKKTPRGTDEFVALSVMKDGED